MTLLSHIILNRNVDLLFFIFVLSRLFTCCGRKQRTQQVNKNTSIKWKCKQTWGRERSPGMSPIGLLLLRSTELRLILLLDCNPVVVYWIIYRLPQHKYCFLWTVFLRLFMHFQLWVKREFPSFLSTTVVTPLFGLCFCPFVDGYQATWHHNQSWIIQVFVDTNKMLLLWNENNAMIL